MDKQRYGQKPAAALFLLVFVLLSSACIMGSDVVEVAPVYETAILAPATGTAERLPLAPELWRTRVQHVEDTGRPLLLSDNPEYVTEPGMMYRDTVDGPARLYLYHATRSDQLLRYAIVLRNNTPVDVTVTMTRQGVAGPSTNYPKVGQDALAAFWSNVRADKIIVGAGEQVHLDPRLPQIPTVYNALVHAIYDIETDGPLEVGFVADVDYNRIMEPNLDHYTDFLRPEGERMRGTFPTSERHITFSVGDRRTTLSFADNFPPDTYLFGMDGVDGTARQNYGNYGVTYHIDVLMNVSEPRRIRLYLGPSFSNAGSCVLQPTVLLTDGIHDDDVETGRVVPLPRSKEQVAVALIGETVVLPGEPRVLRFDFVPPGGSCLPALLFADPEPITADDAADWYALHGKHND